MRIKGVGLFILVSLMITAFAYAFSGVVDESVEVIPEVSVDAVLEVKNANSGNDFELSSVKRKSPSTTKNSELFQSKSWYSPPPAPPIVSLPVAAPSAPQLPLVFLGRMIDGEQITLFVLQGGRQHTVKLGDVIDEVYRLDKIGNINAVFTYLPMNIQQTLMFNSTAIGALIANEPKKY
jgi:hypothetical protein